MMVDVPRTIKTGPFRGHWRSVGLVSIALVLLALSFRTGIDAGMATGQVDLTFRYRVYGVPIVLSQIYFGRPYDYVGYMALDTPLQYGTPSIDEWVPTLRLARNVDAQGLFFIVADDKGIVDFTRLAFLLYGIRTTSLYYMYFTILLASWLFYVIAYFFDVRKLALMVFLCLAFYATVPVFLAVAPRINILDLHTFGILSLMAFLHLLLAATDPGSTRPAKLAAIAGQVFILVCAYHTRSSILPQVLTILAAYPLVLWLQARREHRRSPRLLERALGPDYRRRLIPAAFVLVSIFVLLPIYQRLMYHPDYFGRRATLSHIIFHNLLIGSQSNPLLRESYGLGSVDLGAAHAVDMHLERTGQSKGRKDWAVRGLNTVTTQLPFDWAEYEDAARDLYFTMWREQPMQSLLTSVYWHPLDIFRLVRTFSGNDGARPVADGRLAYNPFRPLYILVVVAAVILSSSARPMPPTNVLIPCSMLASALVVPLVFYPDTFHNLAEAFVAGAAAVFAMVAVAASRLMARIAEPQHAYKPMGFK